MPASHKTGKITDKSDILRLLSNICSGGVLLLFVGVLLYAILFILMCFM